MRDIQWRKGYLVKLRFNFDLSKTQINTQKRGIYYIMEHGLSRILRMKVV